MTQAERSVTMTRLRELLILRWKCGLNHSPWLSLLKRCGYGSKASGPIFDRRISRTIHPLSDRDGEGSEDHLLAETMLNLKFGHLSVTGNFRGNNEDACITDDAGRFFIVADGMGGQAAGEKASELATDIVPRKFDQLIDFENGSGNDVTRGIDEAVGEANAEILALSEIDPNYHNMGTTIVFMVSVAGKFFVGGIGDSRVYQLRDGSLTQLTTDHSLTRALVEAGTISEEEATTHRYRNVLYRYLGSKEGGTGTDAKEVEPKSGDRYLLCSDGVTDGIGDDGIQKVLAETDEPQAAAEAVVKAALDGGSKDNVTSVVVHVG